MISYPPTTLLPSSPYPTIDELISHLCDCCLDVHYYFTVSELEKQQLFDLTMHLIEFWQNETESYKIF